MAHTLVGVQNQPQIYLSSAQQPSYHYGLNKIQNDEVNKKDSCLDRCKIRKVQRDVFTFLEKPFSRILSGKVPSTQKIFEYINLNLKALLYTWFKLRVCTIWLLFLQWSFVLLSQYFQQSRAMKKSHSLFYFIWKVLFWFNIH